MSKERKPGNPRLINEAMISFLTQGYGTELSKKKTSILLNCSIKAVTGAIKESSEVQELIKKKSKQNKLGMGWECAPQRPRKWCWQ